MSKPKAKSTSSTPVNPATKGFSAPSVSQKMKNSMRKDYLVSSMRVLNQQKAHYAGKRVMVTIENPNKGETNKRFIRVPSSTIWKNPKTTFRFSMG